MILAAAAVMTLAACAKIETSSVNEDLNVPITFSTYTPRVIAKADTDYYVDGTTHANLIDGTTFGVFAWAVAQTSATPWSNGTFFQGTGTPGFMADIPVTFHGDTAGDEGDANVSAAGYYSTGNPIQYWPSGDTPDGLSFFAYYPADVDMPATGLGAKSFTVELAAEDQIDFMVAPVVADQWYDHTNGTGDGTVDFTFKHTLTKVKFIFKTDNTDANTTVTLTNAQLVDVYKTNTLTTSYAAGASANAGTFSYNWGTASAAQGFDVTVDGATPSATNVVLSTSNSTCTLADEFLMVPQTIADNTQKITLTWEVTTNGVTTENTKVIDLYDILTSTDDNITWAKNSQVTYTITIGPKPIYFTAAVDAWDSVINGAISVN